MNVPVPLALMPSWVRLKHLYPGVALCTVLALAGSFLAEHYGAPALLLALLLGFGFANQAGEGRLQAGVGFCARRVLRFGVALLGARIGLAQLQEVGWLPLVVVLVSVPLIIGAALWLGRWLGLPPLHSLVAGAAVAICGVSAAVAVAAVLPAGRLEERRLLGVVVCVTALGTVAMLGLPPLTALLGYGDVASGLFLGATIHDVAQAAGAGYLVSDSAGDVATLTKLLRVALLMPLVLLIGLLLRRSDSGGGEFPWFLLGFVALFSANSLGLLTPELREFLVSASQWCLLVTMAALGMRTSVRDLLGQGWRPLSLLCALSAGLAFIVMGLLALLPVA
jgi:uncharacterized integral membrane protein (TIGR00698 family)